MIWDHLERNQSGATKQPICPTSSCCGSSSCPWGDTQSWFYQGGSKPAWKKNTSVNVVLKLWSWQKIKRPAPIWRRIFLARFVPVRFPKVPLKNIRINNLKVLGGKATLIQLCQWDHRGGQHSHSPPSACPRWCPEHYTNILHEHCTNIFDSDS